MSMDEGLSWLAFDPGGGADGSVNAGKVPPPLANHAYVKKSRRSKAGTSAADPEAVLEPDDRTPGKKPITHAMKVLARVRGCPCGTCFEKDDSPDPLNPQEHRLWGPTGDAQRQGSCRLRVQSVGIA